MTSARPGHPLDEHRLALAVGAHDLGVEGHRQLDHGVEPGIRAVAREHLLDRDARVAGAEQVDQAVRRDGIGAPAARRLEGIGLGRGEALEQRVRIADPRERRTRLAAWPSGAPPATAALPTGSQWPLRIERYAASRMRVDDEPVVERLARLDAVAECLHDVPHHRVVAVGVRLVRRPGTPSPCPRRSSRAR